MTAPWHPSEYDPTRVDIIHVPIHGEPLTERERERDTATVDHLMSALVVNAEREARLDHAQDVGHVAMAHDRLLNYEPWELGFADRASMLAALDASARLSRNTYSEQYGGDLAGERQRMGEQLEELVQTRNTTDILGSLEDWAIGQDRHASAAIGTEQASSGVRRPLTDEERVTTERYGPFGLLRRTITRVRRPGSVQQDAEEAWDNWLEFSRRDATLAPNDPERAALHTAAWRQVAGWLAHRPVAWFRERPIRPVATETPWAAAMRTSKAEAARTEIAHQDQSRNHARHELQSAIAEGLGEMTYDLYNELGRDHVARLAAIAEAADAARTELDGWELGSGATYGSPDEIATRLGVMAENIDLLSRADSSRAAALEEYMLLTYRFHARDIAARMPGVDRPALPGIGGSNPAEYTPDGGILLNAGTAEEIIIYADGSSVRNPSHHDAVRITAAGRPWQETHQPEVTLPRRMRNNLAAVRQASDNGWVNWEAHHQATGEPYLRASLTALIGLLETQAQPRVEGMRRIDTEIGTLQARLTAYEASDASDADKDRLRIRINGEVTGLQGRRATLANELGGIRAEQNISRYRQGLVDNSGNAYPLPGGVVDWGNVTMNGTTAPRRVWIDGSSVMPTPSGPQVYNTRGERIR